MKIPLLDLKAQYLSLKKEINEAIIRTVESQHFILGPEVEKLEESIASMVGAKKAIGVSSGTDALLISLMALNIKAGDEVIIPDYSFFATAGVISRLNAVPVFVDIDPVTFNIDPSKIESKISGKTKAIIPVHLYGQSADMDPIVEISKKYDIKIIEDCAQAIGTQYKTEQFVGTIGDVGCFSFFPSKNLGGFGDGGMVVTMNDELGEKIKILRVHGSKPKYYHSLIGGNFRLDSLQAAVLNVKLLKLASWSKQRRANAKLYTKLFIDSGLSEKEGLIEFNKNNKILLPLPVYIDGIYNSTVRQNVVSDLNEDHFCYHIFNQYIIRVEDRDNLKEYLKEQGISTEIYYPVPFHKQICFQDLNHPEKSNEEINIEYKNSIFAANHSLALPIYPELHVEQINYIVQKISIFFNK